jgi:hypothetical protein
VGVEAGVGVGVGAGVGVGVGVAVGVGVGVGVELGVGEAVGVELGVGEAVGVELGVGAAVWSGSGVIEGVGVAVGTRGVGLWAGVASRVSRGGAEVPVSSPGLEGGCAPAAVDVAGGDCACELKTPSAEPIGELRSMIKPTAARRTASASASVRRTLQLRSAVSMRRAQGRELRPRVARPARVTRRPAGEPSLRPRNLPPKSPLPGAGFVAWPPW